jgi:monovalent cation/proton antiporter MnhG/PhaG subunit
VSPLNLAVDVLLGIGVAAELLCVLGVLVKRTVYDRLHYAAAATTVGPVCIGIAIAMRESVSASGGIELTSGGILALVAALVVLLLNPALTHLTARVARTRERGTLEPRAQELRKT